MKHSPQILIGMRLVYWEGLCVRTQFQLSGCLVGEFGGRPLFRSLCAMYHESLAAQHPKSMTLPPPCLTLLQSSALPHRYYYNNISRHCGQLVQFFVPFDHKAFLQKAFGFKF